MAVRKRRAAAVGRATATQGCKKRRTRIASTEDFEFEDAPCLGKGCFGTVVRARHRSTGRTVAIKFPCDSEDPADAAAELQREAGFLAACAGNPYVVGSHGLVLDPATGRLGLAMECVAGPSLHAFLRERAPLPEPIVCAYMWRLLTGAGMMHRLGIVHRDLKPSNILVAKGGKILKICDLGLVMSLRTADQTRSSDAGTLPYMAPEVLLGKPDYDAGADTSSLGCVMAEMLTGKPLFKGDVRRDDPVRQVRTILRVLGSPDDRTWPEFTSLPLAARVRFREQQRSALGDLLPAEMLSEDGYQVLKGLLECNPGKRLTAAAALQIPWFMPEIDIDANVEDAFVPPASSTEENLLRIPLDMWKNAQRRNCA
ncbi:hypothetical protein ZWY2020_018215 [Hordeum vulgare]|nr:hypothetical protein ZWY2020_018215 [Hordeum vulgare]